MSQEYDGQHVISITEYHHIISMCKSLGLKELLTSSYQFANIYFSPFKKNLFHVNWKHDTLMVQCQH